MHDAGGMRAGERCRTLEDDLDGLLRRPAAALLQVRPEVRPSMNSVAMK